MHIMDNVKRKTLKQLAGIAVTTSGFAFAGNTSAINVASGAATTDTLIDDATLSTIQLHTRVSSFTNDIEVVITNTGSSVARITQMTPSQTTTARGTFDFAKLMQRGELTLNPRESVVVPMLPHTQTANGSSALTPHAASLTKALRTSFSVITDNASFARVDVMEGMRLV